MEIIILLAITLVVTPVAVLLCWIRAKRKKKWVSGSDSRFSDFSGGTLTYVGGDKEITTSIDGVTVTLSPGDTIITDKKFTVEKFEN